MPFHLKHYLFLGLGAGALALFSILTLNDTPTDLWGPPAQVNQNFSVHLDQDFLFDMIEYENFNRSLTYRLEPSLTIDQSDQENTKRLQEIFFESIESFLQAQFHGPISLVDFLSELNLSALKLTLDQAYQKHLTDATFALNWQIHFIPELKRLTTTELDYHFPGFLTLNQSSKLYESLTNQPEQTLEKIPVINQPFQYLQGSMALVYQRGAESDLRLQVKKVYRINELKEAELVHTSPVIQLISLRYPRMSGTPHVSVEAHYHFPSDAPPRLTHLSLSPFGQTQILVSGFDRSQGNIRRFELEVDEIGFAVVDNQVSELMAHQSKLSLLAKRIGEADSEAILNRLFTEQGRNLYHLLNLDLISRKSWKHAP